MSGHCQPRDFVSLHTILLAKANWHHMTSLREFFCLLPMFVLIPILFCQSRLLTIAVAIASVVPLPLHKRPELRCIKF